MGLVVLYIVLFLLLFFAASFAVARWSREDPTAPNTFLLLVGFALAWPVTVPLTAAIFLLMGIALLANKLAGGAK